MKSVIATSADLRHWAMQCYDQASDPRASGDERARLLRMREALLSLADEADWLEGRKLEGPSNEERHEVRTRGHRGRRRSIGPSNFPSSL